MKCLDKCSFCADPCGHSWCDFSNNTLVLREFSTDNIITLSSYSNRNKKIIKSLIILSNKEKKILKIKFKNNPPNSIKNFKKENECYIYKPGEIL